MSSKLFRCGLVLPLLLGLGGCNLVVMNPSGDIATQQRDILVISIFLMLLIIVPVMAATVFFAWKYRQSNRDAPYDPEWHHSTRLEVLIWSAPLAIIIALGAITWVSTHTLDPYRPLSRVGPNQPVAATADHLKVQVVSLNWKWLFIYPEQGIATVNELAAPVDVPISFQITSSDLMNSFYVPALAGQVYSMAGMVTQLHAVINKPGVYKGFSANYSGAGFSQMRFKFHGLSADDFAKWVQKVKTEGGTLDRQAYLKLAKPSEGTPVTYYKSVDPHLFDAIIEMCVDTTKACMNHMAHRQDAAPGMSDMAPTGSEASQPATAQADEASGR